MESGGRLLFRALEENKQRERDEKLKETSFDQASHRLKSTWRVDSTAGRGQREKRQVESSFGSFWPSQPF